MKKPSLLSISKDWITIGKKLNGVKTFIAYIRVSTKAQAEVQHGSPEQQRHIITRWAQRMSEETGFQIVLYFIQEEVSGTEGAYRFRHGFQIIEQAVSANLVDGVVGEKLDRFARDQNKMYDVVKLAEKKGIIFYEVESGAINLKDRSNRMSFKIKSMFAEEYSLDLKEKIPKKQREARVNNGKDTSTIPILGLDAHPTKTCMYLNNLKEGKQVRDIAQRCLDLGGVCHELERYCEEKEYKTKARWTREKIDKEGNRIPPKKVGGEEFTIKNLRYLLTNPKLRGTGRFLDTWNQFPKLQDENGFVDFKYAHNPVIPVELFDKVQVVLNERAAKFGRSGDQRMIYLLSGVFVTEDGRRFQGGLHNGGRNPYYFTAKRDILIPVAKIENLICKRVKQYILESGTLEDVINGALKHRLTGLPLIEEEIAEARAKLNVLNQTIEGFTKALREAVAQNPSQVLEITQALLEEKKKAEDELGQLEYRIKSLEAKRDYVTNNFREKTLQEYIKLAMDKFEHQSRAEQKRIVQAIIPKVVYHPAEKKLALYVNPDPCGQKNTPTACHGGGNNIRVLSKWRGVRDSNPRPSA